MKGILFRPEVWMAKKRVLEQYGEAQTRRLSGLKELNKEPDKWTYHSECSFPAVGRFTFFYDNQSPYHRETATIVVKPRYQVGDVVYIKEAWHFINIPENKATPYDFGIEYADGEIRWWTDNNGEYNYPLNERKCSPMFLSERFARYFIKITDVRAERLQEITEADAQREGATRPPNYSLTPHYREWFKYLWDKINPRYPWSMNPWVFVYTFKKVDKP